DEDVDAAAQRIDLRLHADTAVNQGRFQVHVLAIGAHAFFYLRGELSGGSDDQGANRIACRRMASIRSGGKSLRYRQCEACGLAGAGLGGAEQIAPGEHDRDRLRLDGGGLGVALLADSAQQLGLQAKLFKRRSNDFLLRSAWEGSTFDRFRQMLLGLLLTARDGPLNGLRR